MQLQYLLILAVTFLGPFVGLLIGHMTKEELKDGRKYFNLMRFILVLALIIAFFFYFPQIPIPLLIFIIFLIIFINRKYQKDFLIYAIFGILFYLSLIKTELFLITSSIIFLYGLPSGSLFLERHIEEKNKLKLIKKTFMNYLYYIIIALILYLFIGFR